MKITTSLLIKALLLLFLFFTGAYYARNFLMPISIAGVLATLFLPFCKWLEKKKVPRGIAALLSLLLLLTAIFGISFLLGLQISALTNDIPLIKQRAVTAIDRTQEFIFNHLGISAEKQTQILNKEQPSVASVVQVVGGSLLSIFTNFILLLAYIFCLLFYRNHIKQFILRLSPAPQRAEVEKIIYKVAFVSQQYLTGLTKMIVCLWIMYAIGFSILGVKNALFFAILCGLLEIVPFVGNLTGTSLTLFVAAAQGASLPMLGGILLTYGLIQFIQGWLLEPIIVGPQVKINPFTTILALVISELVWGIPGVFLAIPLTAMLKIVCDYVEPLKPFGFLIGEIEPNKNKASSKKLNDFF
jgi:predicted PurR-regulated permease PerM